MIHRHRVLIGALVVVALAAALALLASGGQSVLAQGIIYVDTDAIGAKNGNSWKHAYTKLQPALEAAASGDQIWVAEGIYVPTEEYGGTGDRYRSFQMRNGVALYGGFDPSVGDIAWEDRDWAGNLTILSGDLLGDDGPDFANNDENSYHVFFHPAGTGLDGTAILDGFTITGGNANLQSDHYRGGGMYNDGSSPTLSNCTFSSNWAYNGGGIFDTNGSSPALVDCAFSGNSAYWTGGGMRNDHSSSPTLTNCVFSGNWAGSDGGGMLNDSVTAPVLTDCTFSGNSTKGNGGAMINRGASPVLTNCTFSGNSANNGGGMYNFWYSSPMLLGCTFEANSAGSNGGGIYNTSSSSPTLTNSTFSANSAGSNGGGIYNEGASPVLTSCTFTGNSAASMGGGMSNQGSSPVLSNCTFQDNSASWGGGMHNANTASSPVLSNCTFQDNSASWGGGMHNAFWASPVLTNCTFVSNSAADIGGGMHNAYWASPMLTNCILWGNTKPEIYDDDSTTIVTYSDVQGGYEGEGNIDTYPSFVDAANGDLHLGGCSPCIDAGDNDAPDLPAHDFEGDDRVVDGDGNGTATVDMGIDEVVDSLPCLLVYLPLVLRAY